MKIAKALQKVRNGIAYLTESAVLDFTIELDRLLKAKNISRAELARRIGSSPAYVTKILNGQGNLTVKSMVALAHALDSRVCIQVEPIQPSLRRQSSSASARSWQVAVGTTGRQSL